MEQTSIGDFSQSICDSKYSYLCPLTLAEDWGVGVKMVGPPVIRPARDISHQVHRPSQCQSDKDVSQPHRGSVLNAELISLFHFRNKDLQNMSVRVNPPYCGQNTPKLEAELAFFYPHLIFVNTASVGMVPPV